MNVILPLNFVLRHVSWIGNLCIIHPKASRMTRRLNVYQAPCSPGASSRLSAEAIMSHHITASRCTNTHVKDSLQGRQCFIPSSKTDLDHQLNTIRNRFKYRSFFVLLPSALRLLCTYSITI